MTRLWPFSFAWTQCSDTMRAFLITIAILAIQPEAARASDASEAAPAARFELTEIDFGEVPQGTIAEGNFPFGNAGGSMLRIERVELTSAGMKIAVKQAIEPGATELARIRWDTSTFAGDAVGQATLYLNDPSQGRVILTLRGRVVAPVEILPRPAFYLSKFVGEESNASLLLVNNQQRKLQILGLERQGEHFEAEYEVVEAGKSYRLVATVPAQTAVGRYREAITILTDDPENNRINVEVNVLVKDDVFVSADELDFGRISLRTLWSKPAAAQFFTQTFVINRRSGKMRITSAESDLDFLLVTVAPQNRSDAFTVSAEPIAAELKPGEFVGSLLIRTDDPAYPELRLPIAVQVTE